ncbi:MAG: KOW domain-containing RNA-binding protein [Oscillospiraceae bacterium]|nr:KOW domain-containing RNA-binding protein [Oscillospiraceae bacterium]
MEFIRGLVVRSAAGRDKGGFFAVLQADALSAVICNGKRRSLEHPKTKNVKHLFPTNTLLPEQSLQTNREIRRALAAYEAGDRFPHEEANVCRNRT